MTVMHTGTCVFKCLEAGNFLRGIGIFLLRGPQMHRSAFYFGRNSAVGALNYSETTTLPKPAFRRSQYGAIAGGPIEKDKIFWFGDYEAINQLQGTTQYIRVPAASAWAAANSNVQKFQSFYPATTAVQDASATCPEKCSCYDQVPIVNTSIGNEQYGMGKGNYTLSSQSSFAASYYFDIAALKAPDAFNNQIPETITHRMGASITCA